MASVAQRSLDLKHHHFRMVPVILVLSLDFLLSEQILLIIAGHVADKMVVALAQRVRQVIPQLQYMESVDRLMVPMSPQNHQLDSVVSELLQRSMELDHGLGHVLEQMEEIQPTVVRIQSQSMVSVDQLMECLPLQNQIQDSVMLEPLLRSLELDHGPGHA